ncbi:DUF72 domain-containing protein [Ancylobacter sp. 6x-1]|uniref:DUF72 domain-containing protein n=1 Tax=Ancylobacter crimeensis TaxID=2579147 RepID=A0ABT0DDQ3_9HYPH|nr:DUF72 domain-containing protein [Ancylobacter crimeensis]MCK0198098.1 DUF72 domain-containing protein [Ancylobacter crimeensis]
MKRRADIRIGLSGWTYAPWRGAFYPDALPQRAELAFAAAQFRSIEINGTFYGLQKPEAYGRWAQETPEDFVFAVKAPRFITHVKRLEEPLAPLANFFGSGVLRLGAKLGPVLWQFPASFPFDAERIEPFLALLPHDTEAALALAKRHDERLKAPWLEIGEHRPVRHAMEVRHESFRDPRFVALLRKHDVALVCADTVEWPRLMDLTADFAYVRLHGSDELYRSRYSDAALDGWAARIAAWSEGRAIAEGDFAAPEDVARPARREVFVYFDNTDKLHAPEDARRLMRRLGQPVPDIRPEAVVEQVGHITGERPRHRAPGDGSHAAAP